MTIPVVLAAIVVTLAVLAPDDHTRTVGLWIVVAGAALFALQLLIELVRDLKADRE